MNFRSRGFFKDFLLLTLLTRGGSIPALLLVLAIAAGVALQGIAIVAIVAPFAIVSVVLIYVAVRAYQKAPAIVIATACALVAAGLVFWLQHGLLGLIHDARIKPPVYVGEAVLIWVVGTILAVVGYLEQDAAGRQTRALVAFGGAVAIFWGGMFGTILATVSWHEHFHDKPKPHVATTAPTPWVHKWQHNISDGT